VLAALSSAGFAIEPPRGLGTFGAKFEAILVITEREAYYLDEDLPHDRRWASAGL